MTNQHVDRDTPAGTKVLDMRTDLRGETLTSVDETGGVVVRWEGERAWTWQEDADELLVAAD